MKILHRILGIVISITTILIMLISSIEIAAYSDFGWFEKEYRKYDVLEDLEMEMSDVMKVTEKMMAYLRDDRADLVIHTVVDGEEREFFNEKEKAHMVDVRNLFHGGQWIRRISVLILIVAVIVLILTKANLKRLIPRTFLIGVGSFIGVTLGLGLLFMSDFTKYFTLFHEIFFTNDLWLLNPRTDLMIRMLPEGFFSDIVIRIGTIFIALMVLVIVPCIIMVIKQRNKKN